MKGNPQKNVPTGVVYYAIIYLYNNTFHGIPFDSEEKARKYATDWIATFSGLDGTSDSTAKIRRHSTLRAGDDFKSTRLVGRSAWNDKWLVVIPASSIDADRTKAMNLIASGVKDVKIGIRAYSRSGN